MFSGKKDREINTRINTRGAGRAAQEADALPPAFSPESLHGGRGTELAPASRPCTSWLHTQGWNGKVIIRLNAAS